MTDVSGSDAAYWESRYSESEQIWSGEPNRALVACVADLEPGRALDLGCGEGGDSVWLAERGWQVTAVDISDTAMDRARAAAVRHGVPEGRITWVAHDLGTWRPTGTTTLVSACFLHSPLEFPRSAVLRRAAATVVRGGHLLVVGHNEPPPWAQEHDHHDHGDDHAGHLFLGPKEELEGLALDSASWETLVSEVRSREATGPDGRRATLLDTVVFLRRR